MKTRDEELDAIKEANEKMNREKKGEENTRGGSRYRKYRAKGLWQKLKEDW